MTWTAPQTWTTGQVVTAADMNTDIRDNMLETAAATAAAAGDIVYADAANSMGSRLAIGTSGYVLTSTGSAPAWAENFDHAVHHADSGSDPLPSGSVSSSMASGSFLNSLIPHDYTEVASGNITTTATAIATCTLTIPAGWTSWRAWAMATFAYNTYSVGSLNANLRFLSTDMQTLNVATPTDNMYAGAIVGHRSAISTTGSAGIVLRIWHGGASGTGAYADVAMMAQAYRIS